MSAPEQTGQAGQIPEDGEVPPYIKQQFRLKAFTLVTLQYAVMLIIMLIIEFSMPWGKGMKRQSATTCNIYIGFGVATGLILLVAYIMRKTYPWNYLLLGVVTLLVGVSWGFACSIMSGMMHFHIVSMIGFSVFITTIITALLSFTKSQGGDFACCFAGLAMLLGLAMAVGIDVALAEAFPDHIEIDTVLMAGGIVFLLILVTFADAGRSLYVGNPDEFLRVVIGMTSGLLVVYTIPLFIAIYVLRYLASARKVIRDDQAASSSPGGTALPPA